MEKELSRELIRFHEKVTIRELLELMTAGTPVTYRLFKTQVVLRFKLPARKKYLNGRIMDAESRLAIPYATVEIKQRNTGTVSDFRAVYKLQLDSLQPGDTLLFSSMGYRKLEIPVKDVNLKDSLNVFLPVQVLQKETIEVRSTRYQPKSVGFEGKKSQGELYLDTNGQQTALYIANREKLTGKIEKLRFYLSDKGNVQAPFRIHVYAVDSTTGKPGQDLVDHFLVVQPQVLSGWYEVDIFHLDISIPDNGFYVAMEGVFPNDTEFYLAEQQEMQQEKLPRRKKDIFLKVLSYGQRIGFRKSKTADTWHYSANGEWFRIENQIYNIMVSARLLTDQKDEEK